MITKEDFVDWKSRPVTKAFFSAVQEQIDGIKEELAALAGENARYDGMKVGAIAALRDVLNYDIEEVSND